MLEDVTPVRGSPKRGTSMLGTDHDPKPFTEFLDSLPKGRGGRAPKPPAGEEEQEEEELEPPPREEVPPLVRQKPNLREAHQRFLVKQRGRKRKDAFVDCDIQGEVRGPARALVVQGYTRASLSLRRMPFGVPETCKIIPIQMDLFV